MLDYTVHFQKGSRVGARSFRMVHVAANDSAEAIRAARVEFPDAKAQGYRLTRVDYFDEETGRVVID